MEGGGFAGQMARGGTPRALDHGDQEGIIGCQGYSFLHCRTGGVEIIGSPEAEKQFQPIPLPIFAT